MNEWMNGLMDGLLNEWMDREAVRGLGLAVAMDGRSLSGATVE